MAAAWTGLISGAMIFLITIRQCWRLHPRQQPMSLSSSPTTPLRPESDGGKISGQDAPRKLRGGSNVVHGFHGITRETRILVPIEVKARMLKAFEFPSIGVKIDRAPVE